jgi:hypothetical protein
MPYTLVRTTDWALVKLIVTNPALWSSVAPDGRKPQRYKPNRKACYLLVEDDGKAVGLWTFIDHDADSIEAHCCLLPAAWGRANSDAIFQAMLAVVWPQTVAARMVAQIPECNRLALAYAKRNGMVEYRRITGRWLKRGKRWDLICLEIKRAVTSPGK